MPVPFIDLQRFEPDFLDRWLATCREISAQTQFVGGPRVAALEARMQRELGVAAAIGCANGTDALQLALRAAGVGDGDVVLIPDATFWATFEAVVNVGARPVTVDIDGDDLQMDFELFHRAVEEHRPRAAILVHLYGWGSARLYDFRALCDEREMPLIEDGAQVYGTTWNGASIYRDAYASTVSFYPAKVLGACGDAGAVLTRDPALAETLRQLGNHGRTSHYGHGLVGWNSRMSGFDAGYLDLGLDYLDARLADRRRIARAYRERLRVTNGRVVAPPDGYQENAYLNVTLVDPQARPAIEKALIAHGIGFANVYPGAMSEQPGAEGFLVAHVGGDRARKLSRSVINLPLFVGMRDAELDEVIAVVNQALG